MAALISVISQELLNLGLISQAQLIKFASLSEVDKMENLQFLGLGDMTELATKTGKWEQFDSLPLKNKVKIVKGLAKLRILGMDTFEDMNNMETDNLNSLFTFDLLDLNQQFNYDSIFSLFRPGPFCYKGFINQDGYNVDVELNYGIEDLDYSLSELIVNVTDVPPGLCDVDELNWDMRAKWHHMEFDFFSNEWVGDSSKIGQECNFAMIGGIYDPRRACPAQSDQIENCEQVNRYNDVFGTQCTNILTYPNRFGAAIGDLSTIHGVIDYNTVPLPTINNVTPYFDPANYNKRTRENTWASMSFSCEDGTPLFCLKMQQVICGTDIYLPLINNLLFNEFGVIEDEDESSSGSSSMIEKLNEKLLLEKLNKKLNVASEKGGVNEIARLFMLLNLLK